MGNLRLPIGEDAVSRCPRHPDFDKVWEEHQGLVFWWSRRICRILNRAYERRNYFQPGDFEGYLTLRLNHVWTNYKPGMAAFSTIFSLHIFSNAIRWCIAADEEAKPKNQPKNERLDSEKVRQYHESGFFMYRVPEDDEWTGQMIDLMGDDPWGYLTRGIQERSKDMMELRFKQDKTLEQIGDLYGISKERVRQIEVATLKAIRSRLEKMEPARRLFFGDQT